MRLSMILTAALAAAAVPAVAVADDQTGSWYRGDWDRYSAPENRYWPQNQQPQTEPRYQEHNKLAELTVYPNERRELVRLPRQPRSLDYLELRAVNEPIAIDNITVRLADGRVINTGSRGVIQPGQGRVVNLPRHSPPIVAVLLDYGDVSYREYGGYGYRGYRQPAQLEIFGVPEHRGYYQRGYQRSYDQRSYYEPGYDRQIYDGRWR